MLASLSLHFTHMANESEVLTLAQQEQVADALEHDAEVMSNTKLEQQLAGQPEETQDEIIRSSWTVSMALLQIGNRESYRLP